MESSFKLIVKEYIKYIVYYNHQALHLHLGISAPGYFVLQSWFSKAGSGGGVRWLTQKFKLSWLALKRINM